VRSRSIRLSKPALNLPGSASRSRIKTHTRDYSLAARWCREEGEASCPRCWRVGHR
jgi:hypothetical protein